MPPESQKSPTDLDVPEGAGGGRHARRWVDARRLVARMSRLTSLSGEWVLFLLMLAAGLMVMVAATWAAGEIYESVHDRSGLYALDKPVLDQMVLWRQPWLDSVVTVFTTLGGTVVLPIVTSAVVLFLAWRWRSWLPVALTIFAASGSVAMTVIGKQAVGRVRPSHEFAVPPFEVSPSFPSGHSLNAVVVVGVLVYLLMVRERRLARRRTLLLFLAVYSVCMGLSRVYLGHHWLTDVLTGWLLGGAWLVFVVMTHRFVATLERARRRREAHGVVDSPA
ncbi:phosphatase PAP2 family protein [Austwickia chelonae]|uniref:phosphatase PAP2 family protein n=1 Tax=Austwickia chelonae TaxID=100225 RepID=UPI000E27E5EA|nr:phosphatase PAP2 family protein [Austwickia chelonae]